MYVGIILKKDGKVFLVKRLDTGLWSFPGGLVEQDETLVQAAQREINEEVGVTADQSVLSLVHVLHIKAGDTNAHDSIGFYFIADEWKGIARNSEPHRHSAVQWFDLDNLPADIKLERPVLKGLMSGISYSYHGCRTACNNNKKDL